MEVAANPTFAVAVDLICPDCGREAPAGNAYCGHCGTKLRIKDVLVGELPAIDESEMSETIRELVPILLAHLPWEVATTNPAMSSSTDLTILNIDSLSLIEFVMEVEEHFNLPSVPEEDYSLLQTLGDVARYIHAKRGKS